MAHTTMTTAPAATAEISCYSLAKTLPSIWRERDALDLAVVRTADCCGKEKEMMRRKFRALEERTEATYRLVAETPARNLQDVAAQLLVAIDHLADRDDDQFITAAARIVISSFFVVAREAGIDLNELAFSSLAPFVPVPPEMAADT